MGRRLIALGVWAGITIVNQRAFATVAPSFQSLESNAQLVVEGKVSTVKQVPYTGPRGLNSNIPDPTTQLDVTVNILKVVKGEVPTLTVTFAYPNKKEKGHLFPDCVGKDICTHFYKDKQKFYLVDQSKDERFRGAAGFVLVNAWFGMQSLRD